MFRIDTHYDYVPCHMKSFSNYYSRVYLKKLVLLHLTASFIFLIIFEM